MRKKRIEGRVLMIGCGAVAQCTLPLLFKHFEIDPKNMTIISSTDTCARITDTIARGVNFVVETITEKNMAKILSRCVGEGDLIIDLACNIDCATILEWCHKNRVLYINTSVEVWDPYVRTEHASPTEYTLYARHMALRKQIQKWNTRDGVTAVLDHGANPGLVSHFTKMALEDIAQKLIEEKPKDSRVRELKNSLKSHDFAKIAQLLDVKVIHISERDTQISQDPKKVNEFVNTWSVDGFHEEGVAPAEMGWGTHERCLPHGAVVHTHGPRNQICLAQPGLTTKVRSWVPSGPITGMVVRHGEAFTISDHLTVWDGDVPVYRPTVHYAYCPSDAAVNSVHEMIMHNYEIQPHWRIMHDDIISGADEVGVLLMGHDFTSWWAGTILDIEEARRLAPHQNATTLQVACSVLAALTWMLKNPHEGVRVPDDLPYREILETARPYLGRIVSMQSDWTPLEGRVTPYEWYGPEVPNPEDLWQFGTFLVK